MSTFFPSQQGKFILTHSLGECLLSAHPVPETSLALGTMVANASKLAF